MTRSRRSEPGNDQRSKVIEPILLTPEEAADLLRVSRTMVYRLFDEGLPSVKIGRCRRIRVDALADWISQQD